MSDLRVSTYNGSSIRIRISKMMGLDVLVAENSQIASPIATTISHPARWGDTKRGVHSFLRLGTFFVTAGR